MSERPSLAILALQAVAEWAETEADLASLFARLIGAPFTPSTAAFFALTSGPGQLAAMEAFAGEQLSGESLDVFRAVMLLYRRHRKPRNALAHGRYGVSDDVTDAILVMSQDDHKWIESKNLDASERMKIGLPGMSSEEEAVINDRALRSIFVYRERDLAEIANNAVEVRRHIGVLTLALSCPTGLLRDPVLRMLLEQPKIREMVAEGRKPDRNAP